MKQHKALLYISISILALCAVVAAGMLSYNTKENAIAETSTITPNTNYIFNVNTASTITGNTSTTALSATQMTLTGNFNITFPDANQISGNIVEIEKAAKSGTTLGWKYITLIQDSNNYFRLNWNPNQHFVAVERYNGSTTFNVEDVKITFTSTTRASGGNDALLQEAFAFLAPHLTEITGDLTIIEAGYYIINPNYYSDFTSYSTLNTNFRLYQVETDSEIVSPLSTSGQVQLYDTLEVSQGLYNGIYARYENDTIPLTLYNANNDIVTAYIIQILNDTTTTNSAFENILMPVASYDVLPYWAYTLANDYYDKGVNTNIISDSTNGVIKALFEGLFGSIFAVEIFPGFPLYIFILIPAVFAILSLVLWIMRGK